MNATTVNESLLEISPFKEISATLFIISYFLFLKTFYPPIFYIISISMIVAIIMAGPRKLILLNLLILAVGTVGFLTGALGLKNFRSI